MTTVHLSYVTRLHHNIVEMGADMERSIFSFSPLMASCNLICWFIWLEFRAARKNWLQFANSLSLCHGQFGARTFCANLCIMRLLIFEVIPLFCRFLSNKITTINRRWLFKGEIWLWAVDEPASCQHHATLQHRIITSQIGTANRLTLNCITAKNVSRYQQICQLTSEHDKAHINIASSMMGDWQIATSHRAHLWIISGSHSQMADCYRD